MSEYKNIRKSITELGKGKKDFFNVALDVYSYQYSNNSIFRSYINYLGADIKDVKAFEDFIYLPIEHFKRKKIKTSEWEHSDIFESSGTTGGQSSRHYIRDMQWYCDLSLQSFESQFGSIKGMTVIALLPSYLERKNSSLVAMADHFIIESKDESSGFFLNDLAKLSALLQEMKKLKKRCVVIGVSFALLDLAETLPGDYSGIKFIETGGMKGKRKELTRSELHDILRKSFQVDKIYSEYGMTELLSQAYRMGEEGFTSSPCMEVFVSELNDPFNFIQNKTGRINVIDLANIDTCSFIQTGDLGKRYASGKFEVLGRIDHADLRGCNLMYLE